MRNAYEVDVDNKSNPLPPIPGLAGPFCFIGRRCPTRVVLIHEGILGCADAGNSELSWLACVRRGVKPAQSELGILTQCIAHEMVYKAIKISDIQLGLLRHGLSLGLFFVHKHRESGEAGLIGTRAAISAM